MPHIGQTSTKGPEEKTDNLLIAEFMGYKRRPESWMMEMPNNPYSVVDIRDFKYHEDWNKLMPVVEKIAQHVYETYPDHNGYKETVAHDREELTIFTLNCGDGRK